MFGDTVGSHLKGVAPKNVLSVFKMGAERPKLVSPDGFLRLVFKERIERMSAAAESIYDRPIRERPDVYLRQVEASARRLWHGNIIIWLTHSHNFFVRAAIFVMDTANELGSLSLRPKL
jgi:hypothetical protein